MSMYSLIFARDSKLVSLIFICQDYIAEPSADFTLTALSKNALTTTHQL